MANGHTQTRNRNLTKPDIPAAFTAKQRQFLDAYSTRPWKVADAARAAGCHRCSVYRWMDDPAFRAAMRVTEDTESRRCQEYADELLRQMRAKWQAEAEARTAEVLLRMRKRLRRSR
jgi:hypothetical protein